MNSLPRPTPIMLCGVLGSGKSKLGKSLASLIYDVIYIEKDEINKIQTSFDHIAGNPVWYSSGAKGTLEAYETPKSNFSVDNRIYFEWLKYQGYALMFSLAKSHLGYGKSSILEGGYVKEIPLGYIEFAEKELQTEVKIIYCTAPREEIIRREARPEGSRGYVKTADDWEKIFSPLEKSIEIAKQHGALIVDTTRPNDSNIEEAKEYLKVNSSF
jgi:shikimate kinase